jgi:hypothetical protein
VDALYIVSDALMAANRTRIITLALKARLPTILSYRDYVEAILPVEDVCVSQRIVG